ncbi:MAG TPA: hypothetical protein VK826_03650 [Bacteroidia bacterium]|nr:hypothetical protein [Bacteroidia bacterium]
MATVPTIKLTTSNLVALDVAQAAISRYITQIASQEADPTYAFKISHSDIQAALGIPPSNDSSSASFRVYFGLETEELNFKMRLFLVPLNADDCDDLPIGADGKQRVYDFNLPCPNTCDPSSPLYFGRLNG